MRDLIPLASRNSSGSFRVEVPLSWPDEAGITASSARARGLESAERAPGITNTPAAPTPEEEVVQKGAGFLEGLLSILSNPESTQRLINNITETDAATGQTYLKLPISNSGVVENALKVLTGLFGGLGKK